MEQNQEKTCWNCEHMDTISEDDGQFYCHKLNRYFDKEGEDDACEEWNEEY